MAVFFVILWPRGDDMNITQIIKSTKELDELPFIVVFRTMQVLRDVGMLKLEEFKNGLENAQS